MKSLAMKPPGRNRSIKRYMRYKYMQLLRAEGGASAVALGFAFGMAVEMFTLPTYGLAFFLIFPIVYFFRASLAAALIGFVIGKLIFIPLMFLNGMVGGWVLPNDLVFDFEFLPGWMNHLLVVNLKLIVGGIIDGALLGFLFYFPVRSSIRYMKSKRRERRRNRRAQRELRTAGDS